MQQLDQDLVVLYRQVAGPVILNPGMTVRTVLYTGLSEEAVQRLSRHYQWPKPSNQRVRPQPKQCLQKQELQLVKAEAFEGSKVNDARGLQEQSVVLVLSARMRQTTYVTAA